MSKDGLADGLVVDDVDAVDTQLWNGQQCRDRPTDRRHRHRLHTASKLLLCWQPETASLPLFATNTELI